VLQNFRKALKIGFISFNFGRVNVVLIDGGRVLRNAT